MGTSRLGYAIGRISYRGRAQWCWRAAWVHFCNLILYAVYIYIVIFAKYLYILLCTCTGSEASNGFQRTQAAPGSIPVLRQVKIVVSVLSFSSTKKIIPRVDLSYGSKVDISGGNCTDRIL